MKAGPAKAQFEPAEGKTVKFSDVHGVDEAKEVGLEHVPHFFPLILRLFRNSKMWLNS
jgi:hypothetical protein